jgi:hypothetical protein
LAQTNYVDRVPFRAIVRIARTHGDAVLVGFNGGRAALRKAQSSELLAREYKYDWSSHPVGVKVVANWLPGAEFVRILADLAIIDEA